MAAAAAPAPHGWCRIALTVRYQSKDVAPRAVWVAASSAVSELSWGSAADGPGPPAGGAGVCAPAGAGAWTTTARFARGRTAALRVRVYDPDCPRLRGDGGVGTQAGAAYVFRVPDAAAASAELFPWFTSHRGERRTLGAVHSPQLGNARDIHVYLPPSYAENEAKAYDKVLVQWDGDVVRDPFFTSTVDAATLEGAMEEVVVVGVPAIPRARMAELTPTAGGKKGEARGLGKGDRSLDFVVDTVLPLVRARFPRVRPAPGRLGMAGYSLGGLMSAYALFTRRGTFDRAGCGSPSFWWHHRVMERAVLPRALRAAPARGAGLRCWVDMGAAEGAELMVAPAEGVAALLEGAGMRRGEDLMYELEDAGFHEGNSFLRRLRRCLTFLYPPPPLAVAVATPAARL